MIDFNVLKHKFLELAFNGKLVIAKQHETNSEFLINDIKRIWSTDLGKRSGLINGQIIFKGQDNLFYTDKGDVFTDTDKSNFLKSVPEHWVLTKMKNIGEWGSGATPLRSNKSYYGGDVPWLKTGELNNGYIGDSEEKITSLALKECSLRINKPGDILIAMYGATIGKLGIATCELTTNQACCGCTPYPFIYNKYLFYYLMFLKDYFISISFGGAQPNISKDKITDTYIAFPHYDEQVAICERIELVLGDLDLIDNEYYEVVSLITRLKQRVIDFLFSKDSRYQNYRNETYLLDELLPYEQPNPYIVSNTNYSDEYKTPVLTPGKTFILGYTDEEEGIYHVNGDKVIIFDDFTTASRLVDFDFKVKSSAMKILHNGKPDLCKIDYLFFLLKTLKINNDTHKRYWISEYAPLKIKIHDYDEQERIVEFIKKTFKMLDELM